MLKISAEVMHEYMALDRCRSDEGGVWCYDTYLDNLNAPEDGPHMSKEEYDAVQALDIQPIIADFGMSEHHLGGNDVINFIEDAVAAMKNGYEILTWYGKNTEVLVIGVRPNTLELI